LIVVDDGSTDSTPEVIGQIRDSRVHYVRLDKNCGIGPARNAGVTQARGNLVAFIDSDDIWLPGKLVNQVDLLGKYPHIDLIFSNYLNINHINDVTDNGFHQNNYALQHIQARELEKDVWEIRRGLPQAILIGNFIGTASIVVLKAMVFKKVGNFLNSLSGPEDFEFWWRAAVKGVKFAYITKPLIERHKDRESITSQNLKFAPRYLQALDVCEQTARDAQKDDLIPHLNKARQRVWEGLVRDYALLGNRVEAFKAFRCSLRYGVSPRVWLYLATALAGPKAIHMSKSLIRR
jgi:glycosyltransferase involved in cell wall biosynthesis